MRAFFLKRPPARKLLPAWNLSGVFEALAEASLRDETIKTVFLMAIASGLRRSALHALSAAPGLFRWERGGVSLIPNPSYVFKIRLLPPSLSRFLSSLSRLTRR